MFHCVNCGYEGKSFSVEVAERTEPSYTYRAKCPGCGSTMVNVLPGPHEEDLKIIVCQTELPITRGHG